MRSNSASGRLTAKRLSGERYSLSGMPHLILGSLHADKLAALELLLKHGQLRAGRAAERLLQMFYRRRRHQPHVVRPGREDRVPTADALTRQFGPGRLAALTLKPRPDRRPEHRIGEGDALGDEAEQASRGIAQRQGGEPL